MVGLIIWCVANLPFHRQLAIHLFQASSSSHLDWELILSLSTQNTLSTYSFTTRRRWWLYLWTGIMDWSAGKWIWVLNNLLNGLDRVKLVESCLVEIIGYLTTSIFYSFLSTSRRWDSSPQQKSKRAVFNSTPPTFCCGLGKRQNDVDAKLITRLIFWSAINTWHNAIFSSNAIGWGLW